MFKVLIAPDPAHLRLKMATRTLISVIVVAAISIPLGSKISLIIAALGGLFLSISIYGYTRKEKVLFGIIGGLSMLAFFAIGILSHHIFWLYSPLLVITSFFAFYCRRFGPAFASFPIFSWMMLFFTGIFKVSTEQLWISLGAAAIAIVVSMLVNLFIFPERRTRLFLDNFARHLKEHNHLITWLSLNLNHPTPQKEARKFIIERRKISAHFLMDNQVISGELISRNLSSGKIFEDLLMLEYSLAKALGILSDSILNIIRNSYDSMLTKNLSSNLQQCLHGFYFINNLVKVNRKKPEIHLPDKMPPMQDYLNNLQQALYQYHISEHDEIIYFYNCYTSLERYWLALLDIRKINAPSN